MRFFASIHLRASLVSRLLIALPVMLVQSTLCPTTALLSADGAYQYGAASKHAWCCMIMQQHADAVLVAAKPVHARLRQPWPASEQGSWKGAPSTACMLLGQVVVTVCYFCPGPKRHYSSKYTKTCTTHATPLPRDNLTAQSWRQQSARHGEIRESHEW